MHNDEFNVEEALNTLKKLGYPEKGQNNVVDKAKSYVSCVIGKMS